MKTKNEQAKLEEILEKLEIEYMGKPADHDIYWIGKRYRKAKEIDALITITSEGLVYITEYGRKVGLNYRL